MLSNKFAKTQKDFVQLENQMTQGMTFSQNNKPDEVLDELSSLLGALNIQDKPNKSEKKIELERECYKTHKNTLE